MAVPQSATGVAVTSTPTTSLRSNVIGLPGVLFQSIALMGPGVAVAFALSPGITYAGGSFPLALLLAMIGCNGGDEPAAGPPAAGPSAEAINVMKPSKPPTAKSETAKGEMPLESAPDATKTESKSDGPTAPRRAVIRPRSSSRTISGRARVTRSLTFWSAAARSSSRTWSSTSSPCNARVDIHIYCIKKRSSRGETRVFRCPFNTGCRLDVPCHAATGSGGEGMPDAVLRCKLFASRLRAHLVSHLIPTRSRGAVPQADLC